MERLEVMVAVQEATHYQQTGIWIAVGLALVFVGTLLWVGLAVLV